MMFIHDYYCLLIKIFQSNILSSIPFSYCYYHQFPLEIYPLKFNYLKNLIELGLYRLICMSNVPTIKLQALCW